VAFGEFEERQEQTNAAGHALDTAYCAICGRSPCNEDEEYWGVCPVCHLSPQWLNIGAGHWCYCPQHRLRWFVGANLFSPWKYETEEEQKTKYDALNVGHFTNVKDLPRASDQAGDGPNVDDL
jgi:hypothetical protein